MTRKQKVERATRLRAEGLTLREIGEEMGYAISTVNAWLNDPDRSKEIRRKQSYGGVCEVCGDPTDGSNGSANAPKLCRRHYESRLAERNESLVEMWEAGEPTWYIAERLEMKEGTVRGWIESQRVRRGKHISMRRIGGNAEERRRRHDELIRLRREGLSNAEIAEATGMKNAASVAAAFQWLARKGRDVPKAAAI